MGPLLRAAWNGQGQVFPMQGLHTGDLLMALPAIALALREGQVGVMGLDPRHYAPLGGLPLYFRAHFSTGRILRPMPRRGVHPSATWLAAVGHQAGPSERLPIPLDGEALAEQLMPADGWVVLCPWSDYEPKRWKASGWRALADFASDRGYRVAVSVPPQGAELASFIAGGRHLNLCGRDTVTSWPSQLARAALVVSLDSASVHMADALGVDAIGLYGRTSVAEFGPYWNPRYCVEAPGMESLALDQAIGAFAAWEAGLSKKSPPGH